MGITIKRKDNTSICCSQPLSRRKTNNLKSRIVGLIFSVSLMAIGLLIMINVI